MIQSTVVKKYFKLVIWLIVIALIVFLFARPIDINKVLATYGLVALAAILFAETGLLIGFFLPGDTLLFAAGFFAAQGRLNLVIALIALFIGTFLGNIMGYEIGRRSGPKIFKNEEALLFSKQNVIYAQNFYKKHGGKTILIARFIPIVRTLAPLIAGIGNMRYQVFIFYNFIGGLVWVSIVTMIGYWAGRVVGHYFNIDKYILPVVLLVTLVTLGISFWQIWRDPVSRVRIKRSVKKSYRTFFKN